MGRWFPKKGLWGRENRRLLKQPITNPRSVLQGPRVKGAACTVVPSEQQRGLGGKHAPTAPGRASDPRTLPSFTQGCETRAREEGLWGADDSFSVTPDLRHPNLWSHPRLPLLLTLGRTRGLGLKGGLGRTPPVPCVDYKAEAPSPGGFSARSLSRPGPPPTPSLGLAASESVQTQLAPAASRGAARGPPGERKQPLQRDGGGPARAVLGARVRGALGWPRSRSRVPCAGLRRGGAGRPSCAADRGAAARPRRGERQRSRELHTGPGSRRPVHRRRVAALRGGGARVQQQLEAGRAHLRR